MESEMKRAYGWQERLSLVGVSREFGAGRGREAAGWSRALGEDFGELIWGETVDGELTLHDVGHAGDARMDAEAVGGGRRGPERAAVTESWPATIPLGK